MHAIEVRHHRLREPRSTSPGPLSGSAIAVRLIDPSLVGLKVGVPDRGDIDWKLRGGADVVRRLVVGLVSGSAPSTPSLGQSSPGSGSSPSDARSSPAAGSSPSDVRSSPA